MLTRISARDGSSLVFSFEGERISGINGDTVASALLKAGETVFRTSAVSGEPRGPFCLMGVCFECLVEVDGVQNVQACMLRASSGMVVRRQDNSAKALTE